MISTYLKPNAKPRVLAVFSYRYDAHLVPALLANIEPLVDGWISYDDRNGKGLFSNEVHRRVALLTTAQKAGASWALAVDPDERFESRFAQEIDRLVEDKDVSAYTFALREMYTPDHYRVDGVWGQKRQPRLLSLRRGITTPKGDLHLPWSRFIPEPVLSDVDINLYHLKMISLERRKARAALYEHMDPEHRMQSIGYNYLANDQGTKLERIVREREYLPRHVEDSGLWMPEFTSPSGSGSRKISFVRRLAAVFGDVLNL